MVCELLTRHANNLTAVVTGQCQLRAIPRSSSMTKSVLLSARETFIPSSFAWLDGELSVTMAPETRQADYTAIVVTKGQLRENFVFRGELYEMSPLSLSSEEDIGCRTITNLQNESFSKVVEVALALVAPKSGGKSWEEVFRAHVERERIARAKRGMGNNQLFGTW